MVFKYIAGPVIGAVIGYFTNFIAVKMLFHPKKEVKVFGHRLPFTPGAIPKGKARLAESVGEAVGNNLITGKDIEEKLLSDEVTDRITEALLDSLSAPVNSLFEGENLSPEDIEGNKEHLAALLGKFIAGAVSRVDLAGIISEKAPGIIKSKLDNPMISMFLTDDLLKAVLSPIGSEIQSYIAEHGEEYITPYVLEQINDSSDSSISDLLGKLGVDGEQLKKAVGGLYRKAVAGCADKIMSWLDLKSIVESKINAMSSDELEKLVMSVMKKELNMIVNLGALIGFVLGLLNIFF